MWNIAGMHNIFSAFPIELKKLVHPYFKRSTSLVDICPALQFPSFFRDVVMQ